MQTSWGEILDFQALLSKTQEIHAGFRLTTLVVAPHPWFASLGCRSVARPSLYRGRRRKCACAPPEQKMNAVKDQGNDCGTRRPLNVLSKDACTTIKVGIPLFGNSA